MGEIRRVFTMAYEEIKNSWPPLSISVDAPRLDMALPLFGQTIQYKISIPPSINGIDLNSMTAVASLNLTRMTLGSALLFSGNSNLISTLAPYGLIPHLWTIWELLVQGADFVVCGKDPQNVAEVGSILSNISLRLLQVVLTLSTLVMTPLEVFGLRGTTVKPYVCRGGPLNEIREIYKATKQRKQVVLIPTFFYSPIRVHSLISHIVLTWKEGFNTGI